MENTSSSKKPFFSTQKLTLTAVMTAGICVLGPFSIPLPFSPVPLTFTNLAIYISVFVLGMKSGTISYIIYLLLGAVGLPIFSGFSGGFAKLAGPTGGYLVGFLFLAVITGFFIEHFHGRLFPSILGMVIGAAVCYFFGTIWLAWQMEIGFIPALTVGVVPYLPGDIIKIAIASILGPKLRSAVRHI